MRRAATIVSGLALAGLLAGCSFLEAFEITYGGGKYKLTRFTTEVAFPGVETLGNLTPEDFGAGIPGMPTSLDDFTLAHLVGALKLTGQCSLEAPAPLDTASGRIDGQRTTIRLTACDGDARCAPLCPGDPAGLWVQVNVLLQLISDAKAEDIKKKLSTASHDAIRQFRLQFFQLEPFQEIPGADGDEPTTEATTRYLGAFDLEIWDDRGNTLPLLTRADLDRIAPQTPQRYDLPLDSALVMGVIDDLLAGDEVWLNLLATFWVPRQALFSMRIRNAGLRADVQPEMVVSALEGASSQL